jgi:hypothetical protein
VGFTPNQDTLIKLYQKDLVQLLSYGIYMQMLMILTLLELTPGDPIVPFLGNF